MFNWPTDTDSTGPIQPGVGGQDRPVTDLRQVSPNWASDGYGIRGPQRPMQDQQARPFPIELGQDSGKQSPPAATPGEGCFPGEGADTSLKYVKATQFTDGAWTCIWLPTCPATCD